MKKVGLIEMSVEMRFYETLFLCKSLAKKLKKKVESEMEKGNEFETV